MANGSKSVLVVIFLAYFSATGYGQCGQPYYKPVLEGSSRTRIVNGNNAVAHSWPWAVWIKYNSTGTAFTCGGTLMGLAQTPNRSDIVLTAAHCVLNSLSRPLDPSGFTVYVGNHNVNVQELAEVKTGVFRYIYHSGYRPVLNDIAVLRLSAPVKFNNYIQPACLPQQNHQPSDSNNCYAVGWGRVSNDNDVTATVLQQAKLPVLFNQTCQNVWGQTFDYRTMLCAGYLDGSKSACTGDSGGPLVCPEANGRWTLFGSYSYGNAGKCASFNKPSVFTRISYYRTWIEQQIGRILT